ncbi:hypothetical protein ElyMa_000099700 [Elysia marginata]|uniref:RDD domain-containing protein n=1 Tax=Elysia marginata TaxID=1093978 RepID=A0AAV4EKF3_9GAST|nr:hypothetical protein ElyMa_000099700 [Elysia marginata]
MSPRFPAERGRLIYRLFDLVVVYSILAFHEDRAGWQKKVRSSIATANTASGDADRGDRRIITYKKIACSLVPILQGDGQKKWLSQGNCNVAWSGVEPVTSRSRDRRANHSATLPLIYSGIRNHLQYHRKCYQEQHQ